MTDKEKIELIMQEKHLNNTQFCNEVCIAPGTLSHIRSGRTEPSLNILRSVSQAFPDINPSWLFYDEGDMYRTPAGGQSVPSASPGEAADDDDIALAPAGSDASDLYVQPSAAAQPSPSVGDALSAAASLAIVSGVTSGPQVRSASEARKPGTAAAFSVQDIVTETLRQQAQPQQRKVVEVRIFFDDGTFEAFGPK